MLWRCWLGARRELRDIRPERALLHNPKVPDSSLSACVLKVVRTAQYPSIPAVLRVNNNRRSQKVRWGNGPQAWKMPQNMLTKNCAKFIYFFSAQNPIREAYNGHSGARSPPPNKRSAPSQDKFLATPLCTPSVLSAPCGSQRARYWWSGYMIPAGNSITSEPLRIYHYVDINFVCFAFLLLNFLWEVLGVQWPTIHWHSVR